MKPHNKMGGCEEGWKSCNGLLYQAKNQFVFFLALAFCLITNRNPWCYLISVMTFKTNAIPWQGQDDNINQLQPYCFSINFTLSQCYMGMVSHSS